MRTLESDGPLELAVIVPTHQRREILLKMLAALRSQTLSRNRYEVVVVCDGCTDGTAEAARQALCRDGMLEGLRLTVLEQPRSGAAVARNRGVGASSAPLLLFLDDDMIADPGLLEIHRVRHAQRPGGILLGAIPVHPDSPRSFMTTGLARWAERRNAVLSDPESAIPLAEILTGHMSLSREIFSRLGGFDTRFTAGGSFGGEDLDLGWRAREHGIPIVYDPGAIARQVYRKTFLGLARARMCSWRAHIRE
jgi:GT2 family glycosyltransferase